MTLATKNGSLIVKDGLLAENCGCCSSLCSPERDRATITISGLPTSCAVGNLSNRELSDDNCSYTIFRIRSPYNQNVCKYGTTWHSSVNGRINFGAYYSNRILIDVQANTLLLAHDNAYALFSPPEGKSFKDFPFDEVLVCTNAYSITTCTKEALSSVRVVIDDTPASYVPFVCPQNSVGVVSNTETCSCVPGVDTLNIYSNALSGNVRTESTVIPIYSCAPCDSNPHATQTTTTVYKTPCTSDEGGSCIESISTTSSWPELNVNVSFEGTGIPPLGGNSGAPVIDYARLSGNYALKWTSNAYIGHAQFFGLYFPNPQLTDVSPDGIGSPEISNQMIWQNPDQAAEQGWRVDYRNSIGNGFTALGMTLVVAPVKTTTAINKSAKTVTSTQCGFGQIAYQIKLAVFSQAIYGLDSDYIYWNWNFSCFANVACRSRVCQDVPSILLNSTETVYVPLSGAWFETRGKLGQVSVSISS
jgi:hypothetical protein